VPPVEYLWRHLLTSRVPGLQVVINSNSEFHHIIDLDSMIINIISEVTIEVISLGTNMLV